MTLDSAQVRAFFAAHRTVRLYQTAEDGAPLPLPEDHLDAMLYAAQRAPTHSTSQLASIVLLTDPELRREVADLSKNAHVATASAAFVICADAHRLGQLLAATGEARGANGDSLLQFAIGDAVMMGQNLLLAAEMLGYQGCWIGGVVGDLPRLKVLLDLPDGVLPFAALTIGTPAGETPERPRLARDLVMHDNRYALPDDLLQRAQNMNPIADRPGKPGDWARLLALYWNENGMMNAREADVQAAHAAFKR